MRNLHKLALGVAFAATLAAGAFAQQKLGYNTWTGGETWEVGIGSPGGSSAYIALSQVRNTTGYQLVTGTPTGTYNPTTAVDNLLLAGQPATSTVINTPVGNAAAPLTDAQLFAVCNVTAAAFAANTITLQAATGQTISGGSIALITLAAHTCVELQYSLPTTTWYQIR